MTESVPALSHIGDDGAARMVDVSTKTATVRSAVAGGLLQTTAEVIGLISDGALAKGDALATARIAGIMAAKRTSELIPLCHPLALTAIEVDFVIHETAVQIVATVRTSDRTGVEMEALTAVCVAGLTVHDMIKAVDPAASLTEVALLRKEGGKSGLWTRPEGR